MKQLCRNSSNWINNDSDDVISLISAALFVCLVYFKLGLQIYTNQDGPIDRLIAFQPSNFSRA